MQRRQLTICLLTVCVGPASATAQIPDELLLDGKTEMLFTEPLNSYLQTPANLERFRSYVGKDRCSGSWRGYKATWDIRDSDLYLIQIDVAPCSSEPKVIPLQALFLPGGDRVHATWYSGTLLVPTGRRTQYVHMGYESQYESYTMIDIKNGVVVSRRSSSTRPK